MVRKYVPVILLILILPLSACISTGSHKITEVKIPVATDKKPPKELLAKFTFDLPVFVAKTDPAASSCLTPEGERRLKRMIIEMFVRNEAWKAWGVNWDINKRE